MRRMMSLMIAAMLLLPAALSYADHITLPSIPASLSLSRDIYEAVLTPDNLSEMEAFIQSQGESPEEVRMDFSSKGILLKAYDRKNSRILVVTALADVDATQYFDINEQDAATRARYRASHGKDGAYSLLGYEYDSIAWKNFPKAGRFLMLRYVRRSEGSVICRGFQRRTVRNGLSITIDMQVYGRRLSSGDNTALNKVFDTFVFSSILPMPILPARFDEDTPPPEETGQPSFRMKGKTEPGARLTAVIIPLSTNTAQVYETQADKGGSYTLDVRLPSEGFYVMTLSVEAEGTLPIEKQYSINYEEGLLPVTLRSHPPETITADSLTLAGTTLAGVDMELSVNGEVRRLTTPKNGTFSFFIDTSQPASYSIGLVLRKSGYDTRAMNFFSERPAEEDRDLQAMRENAVVLDAALLASGQEAARGLSLVFEGVITSKQLKEEEWEILIASDRDDIGNKLLVAVSSPRESVYDVGDRVRVIGTWIGTGSILSEGGTETEYPVLSPGLVEPL